MRLPPPPYAARHHRHPHATSAPPPWPARRYTALLKGCESAQDKPQAVALIGEMQSAGLAPDHGCYHALIATLAAVREYKVRQPLSPNSKSPLFYPTVPRPRLLPRDDRDARHRTQVHLAPKVPPPRLKTKQTRTTRNSQHEGVPSHWQCVLEVSSKRARV